MNSVIANLTVMPKNMMRNLNLTGGLVFSQRVLLELPLKGVSREDAYRIVQRNAMKVWEEIQQGKATTNKKGDQTEPITHLFIYRIFLRLFLLCSLSNHQTKDSQSWPS